MTWLGLDLGTSGLKGLLIDAEQRVIARASAPLDVSRPQDGWSEQDPEGWIAAAEGVFDALAREAPAALGTLRGIGLSGHMHGATLLDDSDTPLAPCILWNDTRSHAEAAELDGNPDFRHLSGNIVFPGFTAPKLLWAARHRPEIFAKTAQVLLPKDYLRLWLTGEHVSDMSDASGTSWLDVAARDWSDTLLEASGMTRARMPRLVEGSAVSGTVRPALAARWRLPDGVVVAGGGGDNAASAIGAGVARDGDAFISIGTSGVLFVANDSFRPLPESAVHAFCHALPGTWHQMGVILAATDALNWLGGALNEKAHSLTGALGSDLRAPGRALFLPYLGGERTPHNDAHARGAFVGLSHADDRTALTQAVLEGVAFAFRDNLDALSSAGGRVDRALALGGGSLSRYWLRCLATVLGIPLDVGADSDLGAALGAARLGMLADGALDPATVCAPPAITETILPDPTLNDAFEQAYARYRAAYPVLKGF